MSEQSNGNGNSCLMNMILLAILAVLIFAVFGGALMAEAGPSSQAPSYPSIPAPAPETLNYQPSVQTFPESLNDCPDPSLPYAGWEDGVGGVLPACWTREQQNAYMRSH